MAMSIKRGDQLPILASQLLDPDGVPADLTDCTVVFNMRHDDGRQMVTRGEVEVVNPSLGMVEYFWGPTDTQEVGAHNGEFEVTYPGDLRMTYPNDGYIRIDIDPDLG